MNEESETDCLEKYFIFFYFILLIFYFGEKRDGIKRKGKKKMTVISHENYKIKIVSVYYV